MAAGEKRAQGHLAIISVVHRQNIATGHPIQFDGASQMPNLGGTHYEYPSSGNEPGLTHLLVDGIWTNRAAE